MKRIYSILALSVALAGFFLSSVSCKKEEPEKNPKIELAEGSSTATELSFTVIPMDAEVCRYLCIEKTGDIVPTAEEVMSEGKALEKIENTKIKVTGLKSGTDYVIVAAVSAGRMNPIASKPLFMKTADLKEDECSVSLVPGEVTESSISFTVIPQNADKCSYLYMASKDASEPEPSEIFSKGIPLEKMEPYTATISGLEADTEYFVYAAVSLGENIAVSDVLKMTTGKFDSTKGLGVKIKDVQVTCNSVTFTVIPENAGGGKYTYYMKTEDFVMPGAVDAHQVYSVGNSLESVSSPQTVTIENLRADTEYYIMVAVESPADYTREMAYEEIRTEKLPVPEELPLVSYTEGVLKVYKNNNYVINLKNSDTEINLDMVGSENPNSGPVVETHEYIYVPDASGSEKEWMIMYSSSSVVIGGEKKTFVDGKVTVSYSVPEYTVKGRMVTEDNKAFNFEYTGKLPYPINLEEGKLVSEGEKMSVSLSGNYYSVKLDFDVQNFIGSHTIGSGIANSSSLSDTKGNINKFRSGDVMVSEYSENVYTIKGNVELENGNLVCFTAERVDMSAPVNPGETVIEFNSAIAEGGPDASGYLSAYDMTLSNGEWSFNFWFETSGNYDEVPVGKLIYSSYGGGEISEYRIKGPETSVTDIDEGQIIISKEGDIYKVDVLMVRAGGEKLIGVYTGKIECTDMSGVNM